MITFVYALVLTPFEREYLASKQGEWWYVSQQDFAIHALYCTDTKEFICFGDNLSADTAKQIDFFLISLCKSGITYNLDRRIITLAKGENEQSKEEVAQYL